MGTLVLAAQQHRALLIHNCGFLTHETAVRPLISFSRSLSLEIPDGALWRGD